MLKRLLFVMALIAASFAGAAQATFPAAGGTDKEGVNFADAKPTLDLRSALKPYRAPSGPEADGSSWYMTTIFNDAERPVSRIMLADQPPNASVRIVPRRGRTAILQVASSDVGITVENARGFGRHAFLITVPPATSATIAVRVINASAPPTIVAWTIPALVSHNKQLAIFLAAVAGLIAASIAITTGVAVMTGHLASRWAAIALGAIFVSQLAAMGVFDTGWIVTTDGPDGFPVVIAGLALLASTKLADIVAPVGELWPWAPRYLLWGQRALAALCALTFLGLPGAMLLLEVAVVVGSAGITGYLVHRGMGGAQAARVVAPSSAIFSLVALAAAVVALGGFQDNPAASAIIGGFAAAGAVLLALAISAGEGIAILSGSGAAIAPMPVSNEPPPPMPARGASGEPDGKSGRDAARQAIGASHQGVFDLGFAIDTVRLSPEAAVLLGFADGAKTMSHEAWIARVHTEDRETYRRALADYQGHPGLAFRMEFRVRSESSRYPWFELRATMMGEKRKATRCLGLLADVTTRKEAEGTVSDRALHDSLTGLGNRVALMEELERLGAGLSKAAFVLLDIDRFKSIHASLGDAGGDKILTEVARRLAKKVGDANVFRVGGDAFAVLVANGADAGALGDDLVALCNRPFPHGDREVFATVSVGAVRGRDSEDPFELLKNAELALLQAKRQGGACSRQYSRDLEAFAPGDAVALESELRRALDEGQFDLYYQPIVHLADESVAGFEALLRWRHPQKGVLLPAEFIGHAEETGLILSLGRFALERAARDLSDWQRYFPLDTPLFVSVNVSRRQLRDAEFETLIHSVLAQNDLKPNSFKLEITESAISTNAESRNILANLRAMGVGLAIDDFGTGLSTLGQLRDIPFDIVKLDKSFLEVQTAPDRAEDGAVILDSIVALARELKRSVVIEGVETQSDVARLRETGCEFAQGFYFGTPLPAGEALNFIARHYPTGANASTDDSETVPPSGATGVG